MPSMYPEETHVENTAGHYVGSAKMKSIAAFFIAALVLTFTPMLASGQKRSLEVKTRLDKICSRTAEYGCYTNHKYGYVLAWPKQFFTPQGESDAGDGQAFTSKNGQMELAVWAIYNDVLEQTLPEAYQQALDEPNQEVTYKHIGKNFFVVSGHRGGKIFYRRTVLSNDVQASFDLAYDPSMQDVMDPIVKDISDSFCIDPAFQWQ